MIAFWVWNNNQLINSINLKINYYANTSADIYIRTNNVSAALIETISKSSIFQHIILLEFPIFSKKRMPFGRIPKVRMLFHRRLVRNYYRSFLTHNSIEQQYEHFFCGGFWSDSIYFIDYFARKNPDLKISFLDEGTSSLYFNRNKFIWYFPASIKTYQWVLMYDEFFLRLKHAKRFDGRLYLYAADTYSADDSISVLPLPKINDKNPVCKEILRCASNIDELLVYRYTRCQACFLSMPPVPNYENSDRTYLILDEIAKLFLPGRLIIKAHPGSTEHRTKFAAQFEPRVFVDREIYLFEANFLEVDFNQKILIGRNSAALFYPKAIYGQEPYIIFTFRLYPYYHQFGEEDTERYAQDLKSLYNHPEKIFIPNTIMELNMILQNLQYSRLEELHDLSGLDRETDGDGPEAVVMRDGVSEIEAG